ncbi:MAG: hypothetical protein E5Y59_13620 [Mesorhizobium sp.]|nr:MAG: hypothetical protein E5Y59_13620 [Mesorhizobium sp.]
MAAVSPMMLQEDGRPDLVLDDPSAAVAPLLSVDRSRALLGATNNLKGLGRILTLQDLLADYKVRLTI